MEGQVRRKPRTRRGFELRALRGLGSEIKLGGVPKRRIKKLPIESSRKTRFEEAGGWPKLE